MICIGSMPCWDLLIVNLVYGRRGWNEWYLMPSAMNLGRRSRRGIVIDQGGVNAQRMGRLMILSIVHHHRNHHNLHLYQKYPQPWRQMRTTTPQIVWSLLLLVLSVMKNNSLSKHALPFNYTHLNTTQHLHQACINASTNPSYLDIWGTRHLYSTCPVQSNLEVGMGCTSSNHDTEYWFQG